MEYVYRITKVQSFHFKMYRNMHTRRSLSQKQLFDAINTVYTLYKVSNKFENWLTTHVITDLRWLGRVGHFVLGKARLLSLG